MPPKPPRGDSALTPVLVRLHQPGVHLDGSLTRTIEADGEGSYRGFVIAEDALGVLLRKPGLRPMRIPWPHVQQVEYAIEAE